MLTQITYPTGGKTSFEYELNKVNYGYSYSNALYPEDEFGGLRVKKITSKADANALPVIKTYKYSGEHFTKIVPEIYQHNMSAVRFGPDNISTANRRGDVTGSTIYTDPLMPMSTGSGPIVIYDKVTEYDGTEADNNGKTEYNYINTNIPYYIYDPGTSGNTMENGYYLTDFGLYKPLLDTKIIYGKDQSNVIKEVRKETYGYTSLNNGTFITGVKIKRNNPFIKLGVYSSMADCDASTGTWATTYPLSWIMGQYEFSNIPGVLDVMMLTQKSVTTHPSSGTGDFTSNTSCTYDLNTLQPLSETVGNSKGEALITLSKYPADFPSSAPYNTMLSRNILSPVIEQTVYKGTISSPNFLSATKTNYDYWSGSAWSGSATDIIVPRTVDTKSKDQVSYETRMRYISYDGKANLTTFSKENDVKKTYLWGYNKAYPVAEILGTDYATASPYISQSALDAPASDASLRSNLNYLRSIPGVMVNSYTYKPLVGMTSQTDANGNTIYYEFDAFNRLHIIRDKDNNILKKICYNYAGQADVCQGVESNPCTTCTGNDKKCINGICETGTLKVVSSRRVKIFGESDDNGFIWRYYCSYAYCFSDGSSSTPVEVQTSALCSVQICP